MRYQVPILTILVVTFTTIGMEAAQAAPPTNDNFANATTVTEPLPFTNSVDTTQATVEPTDPACAQAGFDPQNTVWYSYTPSTSGFVQANTFGSDYDTTLWVGTGTAGNLSEIACNDDTGGGTTGVESKVIWDATASTTYYIMAGSCCGGGTNGGNLELTVDTSAPPFTIDDLTISGGKVTPKTGEAVISGSITCSNGPGSVELDIFVSQRIGRATVQGDGFDFFDCSGTQSWSVTIVPFNGLLVAGRAHVEADAFGPDDSFFFTDATIRLRGH
jgi:hypothetical protein